MITGMLWKIGWNGITDGLKDLERKDGKKWKSEYWSVSIRFFHPIWISFEIAPKPHKNMPLFEFYRTPTPKPPLKKVSEHWRLWFWCGRLSIAIAMRDSEVKNGLYRTQA